MHELTLLHETMTTRHLLSYANRDSFGKRLTYVFGLPKATV